LTEGDAATSIQATLSGSTQTAPTYWLNPNNGVSYPVSVQTPQYKIDTLGELKNLPLTAAQSTQLLGGLATLLARAARRGRFALRYQARRQHLCDDAGPRSRRVAPTCRKSSTIPAPTCRKARPSRFAARRTMTAPIRQLFIGLAMSIVLIYLLIVVNFQSWLDPFVIIMALPAALAGIVWMLFLTFTTLSVPALTGAIMCMGVATANSILVVSFAREQLAEGKDALTAALEAGGTRFRPVIMTALAMIIGMAPMAIEPGQNAPLGRAVIGGLLFATFATLVFVPVLFSIAHGRQPRSAEAANPAFPRLTWSSHVFRTVRPPRQATPDPVFAGLRCGLRDRPGRRSGSSIAPGASRRSKPGPTSKRFRPCVSFSPNPVRRTEVAAAGQRRAFNISSLFARASGYVTAWHSDIGAHVKKGDVLRDDLGARSRPAA
jgi:hypothetical protein